MTGRGYRGSTVFLMTRGLAMAWGHCVAPLPPLLLPLLLLPTLGLGQRPYPRPGAPGLRHSYDCGLKGMQLLVFLRQGQTVRFKVLDEFGNEFEVSNCSICYHWVTAKPRGPAVFSSDYKGCHVLQKDGRSHLRVLVEAVLPGGRVHTAQNVTLVCPKPEHTWMTLAGQLTPPTTPSLPTAHPGSLGPTAAELRVVPPPSASPSASTSTSASASPSLGPGPTRPSWAHPHGGDSEQGEVSETDYLGTNLTPEQCQGDTRHIPCIVKRSSKEACQLAGCCYDNTRDVPCYYGNTATVQCLRNGHLVLVVSQETALAHKVTLANVRVAYAPASCSPAHETESFVVFHFPLTHCGTTVQVAGNQLIYENQLASVIDVQRGPQGSITRDGTFRIHVRCIFNASDFLPLQASVVPLLSPPSVTQHGPLHLQLRIAKDENFHSYYEEKDYPIMKQLLEPVAVEVRLLQRTDPRLVLVLHGCWATPSANPFQQPQWPILSDGCPFEGDNYRTRMVALDEVRLPFPTHYQRFTVATFVFLDSGSQRALRGPVYFFCSASACSPTALDTCSTTCGSRTTRQQRSASPRRDDLAEPQDLVSSPGPVGFVDSYRTETTPGPSGSTRNSGPRPLLWVVLLLAAAALVLGIGVSVGLRQAQARRLRGMTEGERAQ